MRLNLTVRNIVAVTALFIAVVACGLYVIGWLFESRTPTTPQSSEHTRSLAEAYAILDQPILKRIGISQTGVMKTLGITTPMIPEEGEPFMGHRRLVGYNKEDRIQVKVIGPEDNLWNISLFFFLDGGKIDPAQPSHRRAKTFLDHWIGADAWIWTAQMVETLIPNGSDTQTVQRTFGDKTLTAHLSGPSAKNPAAISLIVVPATQDQQMPGQISKNKSNEHPPGIKYVPLKPDRAGYHPLD